ncbi:TonB-dependent receptor SusC, partial [termite gut metagenome]
MIVPRKSCRGINRISRKCPREMLKGRIPFQWI